MPAFGGFSRDRDAEAVKILKRAYGPGRKVVSVSSREVLLNAGNVHCITQQNPSPTSEGSAKGGRGQAAPKASTSGIVFRQKPKKRRNMGLKVIKGAPRHTGSPRHFRTCNTISDI